MSFGQNVIFLLLQAHEQYFSTLAKKEGGRGQTLYTGPRNAEQEKEEQWERMTNPHLFGGDRGAFRKSKVRRNITSRRTNTHVKCASFSDRQPL